MSDDRLGALLDRLVTVRASLRGLKGGYSCAGVKGCVSI
jgi:hypothetical protein